MTYRPNDRQYTSSAAHFAHYRKAAKYRTETAARQAARDTEIRRDWPPGVMEEYYCPVPGCEGWHVGRTREWVAFQRLDARPRIDMTLSELLGARVMAHAKLENTGPDARRRAHIKKFEKTIERMAKQRVNA